MNTYRDSSEEEAYAYHIPPRTASRAYIPPQPLISRVTNDWIHDPRYKDDPNAYYDSDSDFSDTSDDDLPPALRKSLNFAKGLTFPKRVRRWLLGYIVFVLSAWFAWLYIVAPSLQQLNRYNHSFDWGERQSSNWGGSLTPDFADMVLVGKMDEVFLPSKEHPERRLVFVGDVHGCRKELQRLLDKVGFHKKRDHLVLTGDIISKGPDSQGVVDLVRELGASCVRGNHEDKVLLAAEHMNNLESEHSSKAQKLAKELSKENLHWLRSCPVILDVGNIRGSGPEKHHDSDFVVVHAGLVPGVALDRQDPFLAMNMRSIDLATRVPSSDRHPERGSVPWETVWEHAMKRFSASAGKRHNKNHDRRVVVYGHDSKTGLNIKTWSKGLDSGCVGGGELTALVVGYGKDEEFMSVKCKHDYKSEGKHLDALK